MAKLRAIVLSASVLAIAGISAAGCGNAFETQAGIKSLRVLGVQIDTPYAKPGTDVHLKMLLWDGSPRALRPDGSRRPVQVLWIGGCFNPAGDLYYGCYPSLGKTFGSLASAKVAPDPSVLKLIGQGDSFTLSIPADILATRPPASPETVPYGLAYVFFVACGGKIAPAGDGSDRTVFPLKCVDPETGADFGSDDFVVGYTPIYTYETLTNANPIITGATWQDVPSEQKPGAFGSCTPQSCKPGTACGSNGYCLPVVDHCTSKTVTDCVQYSFKPTIDRASQEIDEASPPIGGTKPFEAIWVAYFATQGFVKSDLALVNDSQKGWNEKYELTWSPPSGPAPGNGEARIFAVVHDSRGGTSWWWQDVIIR